MKSKQKSISKNKRHLVTIDQISKKTSDAPFGTQLKSKDYAESGIPVIQGRNIKENKFHWNNKKYTSKEKFDSLPRSHCSKGDLIFPKIGTIGNVCILPSIEGNEQCILSTNSMSCSINEKLADPNYIYYYFCQKKIHDYINSTSRGSTQPIFNYGMLKAFSIEIPSLEIQLKVSKILQELDSKIENLQNQNKILEQMAQTIFKSWFVDFDGVIEFDDSELGKIPKGWIVEILENVKDQKKNSIATGPFGSNLKTSEYVFEGIPVIRGKDFEFGLVKQDNFVFITKEKANSLIPSNVFSKDILITSQGNVGNIGFVPEISKYSRYVISSNLMKISINSKIMPPVYVYYYLKSIKGQQELLGNTSTTGVPHIAQPSKVLRNTRIIIPNTEILKNFNMITTLILQIISKNKNEISSLTSIRDVLLPKLMSGEIRV